MTAGPGAAPRRRLSLPARIFLGLLLGAGAGILANRAVPDSGDGGWVLWAVENLTQPAGEIFLRLLFMIVVPLVFSSLALGVAGLGDLRKLGRIGALTLGYFFLTTALAAALGLLLVQVVRPGAGLPPEVKQQLLESFRGEAGEKIEAAQTGARITVRLLVDIVPRNPVRAAAEGNMLPVIFFSLMVGIALTRIRRERSGTFLGFLEGLADVTVAIIDLAMRLAPVGVFCLIFTVTARFGFDVVRQLGSYVLTVLLGLAIHQVVVFSVLVRTLGGIPPLRFFRQIRAVMITGFSTSSSSATLPTTMRVAEEEVGIPREISGFVLPLGATLNMNGTALFEGITCVFLAEVFGIELTVGQQLFVILMAVLTAIGSAGVPAGSIPLLVGILMAIGVPGEGIAIILGVDRILDMSRTVLNVTGDITAAAFVARRERLRSGSFPPAPPAP